MQRSTFTVKAYCYYRDDKGERKVEINLRPVRQGYLLYIDAQELEGYGENHPPVHLADIFWDKDYGTWGIREPQAEEYAAHGGDPISLAVDWMEQTLILGRYTPKEA